MRANFTWFHGNKLKYGRDPALSTARDDLQPVGPVGLLQGEVNFVIGSSLFITGRGSHFPTGFGFQPQGGMDKQVYQDDSGVWHGSYWEYLSDRPQQV